LGTTVISRFELLVGARTARQREAVEGLLNSVPTLSLDGPCADRAAGIRRELTSKGEGIGMADSLIPGIVLHHGGVLLTRNQRHFRRIADLPLMPLDQR